MGWPTILTNGTGVFGTCEFCYSVAHNAPVMASSFLLEPPQPIGPEFARSPAKITDLRREFDGTKHYSELEVEFTGGGRIGNRSFVLHDNVLRLLADSAGMRAEESLITAPLTVFHEGNRDVGFSLDDDVAFDRNSRLALASGGMYLGLPIFFRDMAVNGGIVEGAEGVWEHAGATFPYEMREGAITWLEGQSMFERICLRLSGVKDSLLFHKALSGIVGRMFDAESHFEMIGRKVTLYLSGDDLVAVRPR